MSDEIEELLDAAIQAEEALGNNIVWLRDSLAIMGRQKEGEKRLKELDDAWEALAKAITDFEESEGEDELDGD